jgi:dolichol-phosphate mannosyltransferase
MSLAEPGYAMPIELWVQAVHANLRIREIAVPLIYLEEARSFGGALDDAQRRLDYYRSVLEASLRAVENTPGALARGDLLSMATGSADG